MTAPARYDRSIFDALRLLRLDDGDFAVFGSGPLLARGIIETVADLDVIARGAAWQRAVSVGRLIELPEGVSVVSCNDGAITIGTTWAYGAVNVDHLIDTADMIDGLPFVRLEHVIAYKRLAGRRKDLDHLDRIAEYRRRGEGSPGTDPLR